ncbi:carbohydrate ABC transporter permease [Brachybacterium kimchii]|uniref:Carbohydrate ABC transporter permease n=1 Tax=Brachybacterium kimchii TaxID=2942909 RepID=A0ABY4N0M0_9MICO|nr:carbohydrate ABC transporter permease [Brachybacterium kimchii]UQN28056.1 carbohydrate ABC transporter permease [Brachybacterium kimchii]
MNEHSSTTTSSAARPVPTTPAGPARRRRPSGGLASKVGTYVVLLIFLVLIGFPVYFGFAGSLMGPGDINAYPAALWPRSGAVLRNFADALDAIPLLRQWGNSVAMAGIITVGQMITSVLASFALVFLPMRWRNFWFFLLLSTMMVPVEAIIIPNYLFISDAGLINTLPALTLPFLAHGFGIFLLRQAFMSFPSELFDAARIDGCSNPRFLLRILVPLSRPTLMALGFWSFLMAWNMYFWPLLVTQTPQMQTIQIGITQLKSADNFNAGLVLAGTVLAVVPTLLLLIFGQRFIVRGLTGGAIK